MDADDVAAIERVLVIRSDVVAIKVRQIYSTADGPDVGTPLWVMSKEEGRWLMAACQNTGAPAEELAVEGVRPVFGAAGGVS